VDWDSPFLPDIPPEFFPQKLVRSTVNVLDVLQDLLRLPLPMQGVIDPTERFLPPQVHQAPPHRRNLQEPPPFSLPSNNPSEVHLICENQEPDSDGSGNDRFGKIPTHKLRSSFVSTVVTMGVPIHLIERDVGHVGSTVLKKHYLVTRNEELRLVSKAIQHNSGTGLEDYFQSSVKPRT
jgi:hypothetical protein